MTSRSLYDHLKVTPNASLKEINAAFRRQALKWHPERNSDATDVATKRFAQVCESYEVLSDGRLRALYDRYGYEALRDGVPGMAPSSSKLLPFQAQNPAQVFKQFFGTENPFESFFHEHGLTFHSEHAQRDPSEQFHDDFGPRIANLQRKRPEVVQTVYVSLSDLYLGRDMRVQLHTEALHDSQNSATEEQNTLNFTIDPGLHTGARIRFEKQINSSSGAFEPADVVFVIHEKPHTRYTREGNNLVYRAHINLLQALTGGYVEITTLDDRQLRVPINEIISPKSRKCVRGEGMPIRGSTENGDLYIEFDIAFPAKLTVDQKEELKAVFEDSTFE